MTDTEALHALLAVHENARKELYRSYSGGEKLTQYRNAFDRNNEIFSRMGLVTKHASLL